MAYTVSLGGANPGLITINDNELNETYAIPLLGRNRTNYGQPMALALTRLLSNFAGPSAPAGDPLIGQLWYDTANQELKIYDDAASDYISVSPTANLAGLDDTAIGAPTVGQVLRYNGTAWANGSSTFQELSNTPSTLNANQFLRVNSAGTGIISIAAISATDGSISGLAPVATGGALTNLTDVTIAAAPAIGNSLRFNGTNWVNQTLVLNDLGNVDAAAPVANQVLTWNDTASAWVPQASPTGVNSFLELVDTPNFPDYTGFDGFLIVVDEADDELQFIDPATVLAGAGLATVAFTGDYNDLSNLPNLTNFVTLNTVQTITATKTHTANLTVNATLTVNGATIIANQDPGPNNVSNLNLRTQGSTEGGRVRLRALDGALDINLVVAERNIANTANGPITTTFYGGDTDEIVARVQSQATGSLVARPYQGTSAEMRPVGFREVSIRNYTENGEINRGDSQRTILRTEAVATSLVVSNNADVALPIGTTIFVINGLAAAGNLAIIAASGVGFRWVGGTVPGEDADRLLAPWGIATLYKQDINTWLIWGIGLS